MNFAEVFINILYEIIANVLRMQSNSIVANKRLIFFIFIFFLAVNLISAGGHFDWWDGVEAFLVTESMVLKHSAKLHPDVPGIKSFNFPINYTVYVSKTLQTGKYFDEKTIELEPVYTVRSLLLSAIAVPFLLCSHYFFSFSNIFSSDVGKPVANFINLSSYILFFIRNLRV